MAPAKRTNENEDEVSQGVAPAEKIARLFGLLVVRGVDDKEEQALMLLGAGFAASEIAEMLQVNRNYAHAAKNRRIGAAKKNRAKR